MLGRIHQAYQVPITNSSLTFTLFAICLSFSSPPLLKRFSEKTKNICLFIRPSSVHLFVCFLLACVQDRFIATKSEPKEIFIEKDSNNLEGNFYDFASNKPHEEPTIMHTKKFRIGSGNIIGKGVIQDFLTCAGTLPTLGGSILNKTNSPADAITLLIIELERQFVHMHPCIQRIFLEFSNI